LTEPEHYEAPWKAHAQKFRTEYICLKCHKIYYEDPKRCVNVLPNGRICDGPICPRVVRAWR
jgi:hypothetical protein